MAVMPERIADFIEACEGAVPSNGALTAFQKGAETASLPNPSKLTPPAERGGTSNNIYAATAFVASSEGTVSEFCSHTPSARASFTAAETVSVCARVSHDPPTAL